MAYKIILLVYKVLKYSKPKYLRNYLQIFYPETNVMVRHANHPYRLSVPITNSKPDERAFVYTVWLLGSPYCIVPVIYDWLSEKEKN